MPESSTPTALVTGGTGAIGAAICRQLAGAGFAVVVAARDERRAGRVLPTIGEGATEADHRFARVDVSVASSILALRRGWRGRLELLVNCAAVTPRDRRETAEGVELQFATNVLGYHRMTRAFSDVLVRSAPARIVDVASYYAGDLDLTDLEFERRPYDNDRAYRQSKQANRMLVAAWNRRLPPAEVTINACHPGDVNSKLSNDLGFGGSESPDQGAATPVWAATSPIVAGVSGAYFAHRRRERCRFAEDERGVEALFEACEAYG